MSERRPFWILLALAAAMCLVYTSTSIGVVGGELIPPLDDAFIHFQYARRLAEGHPFSYQAGDGWSSGATSLTWPALLAIGWRLGFTDTSLYVWTLLLNTVLLAVAGHHTRRWVARAADARTAAFAAGLLLTTGPFLWAAFSGMEVVLFGAAIAAILDGVSRPDRAPGAPAPGALTWAAVLATIRPEGAVLVGILAIVQAAEAWLAGGRRLRAVTPALVWGVPVALGAVQPLLNLVNTGMLASSSALAKHNPRFAHPNETVFSTFVWETALWGAYGTHYFGRVGVVVIVLFAVGAWTLALADRARGRPGLGALALVWWAVPLPLLALFLPLGWHHYRYLLPYLVVFVPGVAIGAAVLDRGIARLRGGDTPFVLATVTACLVLTGFSWANELGRNARDIRQHQVDVARWVAANLPPDAVVAANDVGALGYLGGRRLVDLEGIVSMSMLPDALEGEGSTWARILRDRPDVFVVFPSWFDTSFASGALVARRHSRLTDRSISGGDDMVVATLDPAVAVTAERPPELAEGESVIDTLDVSDRADEEAHGFWLADEQPARGRGNRVVAGTYPDGGRVVENARRMEGDARVRLARGSGSARLVGRFGPSERPSRLFVRVDGQDAGVWDLPAIPEGAWRDVAFPLPAGSGTVEVDLLAVDVAPQPTGGWHLARLWVIGG